jgi:hypothetical protein
MKLKMIMDDRMSKDIEEGDYGLFATGIDDPSFKYLHLFISLRGPDCYQDILVIAIVGNKYGILSSP